MKRIFIISMVVMAVAVAFAFRATNNVPAVKMVAVDSQNVKVTMYYAGRDGNGTQTYTGVRIKPKIASSYRIIAISHDLVKRFPFGSKITLEGIGGFSGIYQVQDLMNARWRNRIDILISRGVRDKVFKNVKLTRLGIPRPDTVTGNQYCFD